MGDQIENLMMAGHRLREARQTRVDAGRMQELNALINAEGSPNPNMRKGGRRRRACPVLVQPPRFAAVREHGDEDDLPPAA